MKKLITLLFIIPLIVNAQDDITAESLGFGFKTYSQGTAFNSIAYDSINKKVWAGTFLNGVFNITTPADGSPEGDFSSFNTDAPTGPDINAVRIQSMAADGQGNIWIGHNGFGSSETQGGIELISSDLNVTHFFSARDARGYAQEGLGYLQQDGLGTRDVKSLVVDKNNTLWAAQKSHQLLLTNPNVYIVTPGTISYKTSGAELFESISTWKDYQDGNQAIELPYPAYTYNPDASQTAQTRNVQAISSDSTSVWVGSWNYLTHDDPSVLKDRRILKYNLDGSYANQEFTFDNMMFPPGGIVNGLCTNNSKGIWVTTSFTNKGFSVYDGTTWTYMSPTGNASAIIPSGAKFNDNAIWKNAYGNVFLGTTKGLIVYDGRGPVNEASSYTLYSKTDLITGSPFQIISDDMVSNNITAGVSQDEGIQWMATNGGIMRVQIGHIPTGKFKDINGTMLYTSNPRSVNDLDINYIVEQFETRDCNTDATCHHFDIKTTIVSPNSAEAKYATVENVYHMMKKHMVFQAILPLDIPRPILGDKFLTEMPWAHIRLFEDLVDTQTQRIFDLQDIMDLSPILEDYDIKDRANLTVLGSLVTDAPDDQNSTNYYLEKQLLENNQSAINGATYKLYATQPAVDTRDIFKKNYENLIFPEIKGPNGCVGDGILSEYYDPIVLYVDDKNYKMVNYTEEGHIFYPGTITRTIKRDNTTGEIYVLTEGDGFHFCSGAVGVQIGKSNHMTGSTVFKNVDIRFKRTFGRLND